jgi:hypothetical protein
MTMYSQFLQNDEITLTKIKTKILIFFFFKILRLFLSYSKFYRGENERHNIVEGGRMYGGEAKVAS